MPDESMRKQALICPQCGGTMKVRFIGPQQDKRAVCLYCRSEIDLPDADPAPQAEQALPSYPAYPLPPPVSPANNSLAAISLIAGIAGVMNFFPFFGSIVAIVTGKRALEKIRREPGRYGGEKMARTGILLGYLGLAFGLLMCCFYFAIYGMAALQGLLQPILDGMLNGM